MSIQRWNPTLFDTAMMEPLGEGEYVTYADHLAALLTQDQQHGEQSHGHYMDGYAAGLGAAREAVAATFGDHPCSRRTCTDDRCAAARKALAAIDALRGESND